MTGARSLLILSVAVLLGRTAAAETFDYQGCAVTVSGATVSYAGGEPVLTFTRGGTLSVSHDVRADILVVGGGGGGGGAYYNVIFWFIPVSYGGNGGNGGEVRFAAGQTLPANGSLAVQVGQAGAGGAAAGSGSTANGGTGGGGSSLGGSSFAAISASGGAGGAGGSSSSDGRAGSDGTGAGTYDISGQSVAYGAAGSKPPSGSPASDVTTANGQGGQGGCNSDTQSSRAGGRGGAGIVIVRLKEVLVPREPIEKPAVVSGLVYDGTRQTGVAAGDHYTLGGTWAATAAGSYEATATPANGYCWPDGTHGALGLAWSIAKRPVLVRVLPTAKTAGEEEPVYLTKAEGFVAGDGAEVSWKVWRTNLVAKADGSLGLGEAVGTYDLVVAGTAQTTNYTIAYANGSGAFEIRPAGPSIPGGEGEVDYDPENREIVVRPNEGVKDVEIANVPDGATVKVPVTVETISGVTSDQVVIVADATNETGTVKVDISGAFKVAGTPTGVTIALDDDPAAAVEVEIGGTKETVRVRPELTDSGDTAAEPLTVAEEAVALGVKTIPGLTYWLKRSSELGGDSADVASEKAKGTRTKLTDPMDGERPRQAFYQIEVTK